MKGSPKSPRLLAAVLAILCSQVSPCQTLPDSTSTYVTSNNDWITHWMTFPLEPGSLNWVERSPTMMAGTWAPQAYWWGLGANDWADWPMYSIAKPDGQHTTPDPNFVPPVQVTMSLEFAPSGLIANWTSLDQIHDGNGDLLAFADRPIIRYQFIGTVPPETPWASYPIYGHDAGGYRYTLMRFREDTAQSPIVPPLNPALGANDSQVAAYFLQSIDAITAEMQTAQSAAASFTPPPPSPDARGFWRANHIPAALLDSDGDGLSNAYEAQHGSSWLSEDTDLDGLRDDIDPAPLLNEALADPDGDHGAVSSVGLIGRWDFEELSPADNGEIANFVSAIEGYPGITVTSDAVDWSETQTGMPSFCTNLPGPDGPETMGAGGGLNVPSNHFGTGNAFSFSMWLKLPRHTLSRIEIINSVPTSLDENGEADFESWPEVITLLSYGRNVVFNYNGNPALQGQPHPYSPRHHWCLRPRVVSQSSGYQKWVYDLQLEDYTLQGTSTIQRDVVATWPLESLWTNNNLSGPLDDGKWHHVVFSFDLGTARFWLDGEQINPTDIDPVLSPISFEGDVNDPSNQSYCTIGTLRPYYDPGNLYPEPELPPFPVTRPDGQPTTVLGNPNGLQAVDLKGSIDRLRVYSRVLPSNDVQALYNTDIDGDGFLDRNEARTPVWRDFSAPFGLKPFRPLFGRATHHPELDFITRPFYHDPEDADHDGDGLLSSLEQQIGSDLGDVDTDGDLLPDGWEYHSFPPGSDEIFNPNTPNGNFDSDGLSNLNEYRHNTDPTLDDTDDDGTNDGPEVAQGGNPNDPDDGGMPAGDAPEFNLLIKVGDHSGSESETYELIVREFDATTGDEGVIVQRIPGQIASAITPVALGLPADKAYSFQLKWVGTTNEPSPSGLEGPDFDYHLDINFASAVDGPEGLVVDCWDTASRSMVDDFDLEGEPRNDVTDNAQSFRALYETKRVILLPMRLGLVQLDDDGSLIGQQQPFVEMNMAGPKFDLAGAVTGTGIDGNGIFASFSLSGTVRSKSCDAVAGTLGTITEVSVEASGISTGEEPLIVSTQVNKAQAGGAGPFAYPFSGGINLPSARISLTEGVNTVSVEATDPVSGQLGKAILAFDVAGVGGESPIPEFDASGLQVSISGALDELVAGQATLTYTENGISQTFTLDETNTVSREYESVAGDLTLKVVEDDGIWSARFSHEGWGLDGFTLPLAENNGTLSGQILATTLVAPPEDPDLLDGIPFNAVIVSNPEVVAQSGAGEARVYAIRVAGFDLFDESELEKAHCLLGPNATELHFIKDATTGAVLLEDPDREGQPVVVLPRPSEEANSDEGFDHKAQLEKYLGEDGPYVQWVGGCCYGICQGGVDLVVGLGVMIKNGVEWAYVESARGIALGAMHVANFFGNEDFAEDAWCASVTFEWSVDKKRAAAQEVIDLIESIREWLVDATTDEIIVLFFQESHPDLVDEALHNMAERDREVLKMLTMLYDSAVNWWEDAPEYEKGRYTGLLIFEIASSFISVSKVAQLGKVKKFEWLAELARRDPDIPGWPNVKAKAAQLAEDFANTKMCFVAGTLVLARIDGQEQHCPIEQLEPLARSGHRVEAWSRDEETASEGWKLIVEFFTTRPTELVHLDYELDDGSSEVLVGTAPHPFWVLNRDEPMFVPMGELEPGDFLYLNDGKSAVVKGSKLERAPPGQGFTTFNFEVADFHTYFVGEPGVWVHNLSISPCEEVFNAFYLLTEKITAPLHGKPWNAFDEVAKTMGKNRNSSIFGWAADEVMRKQLKELPLQQRIAEWPSHSQVKATMSRVRGPLNEVDLGGTNFGEIAVPDWIKQERIDLGSVKSFTLESHHGVPKKVQEWLGLTKDKDSVPAYLTTMLEHRGADVGIHQALAKRMRDKINGPPVNLNQARPSSLTNDMIRESLQETYEEFGLGHFWDVCEHWIDTP